MPELPDAIFDRVRALCEQGDARASEDRYDEALLAFGQAWELLPEPREDWGATLWLLGALGDVHYLRGDFPAARDALQDAMRVFDMEAVNNPFLALRLGQTLYELGDHDAAAQWLTTAYGIEGADIFEGEDGKYAEFLKTRLEPPEGGWPAGF